MAGLQIDSCWGSAAPQHAVAARDMHYTKLISLAVKAHKREGHQLQQQQHTATVANRGGDNSSSSKLGSLLHKVCWSSCVACATAGPAWINAARKWNVRQQRAAKAGQQVGSACSQVICLRHMQQAQPHPRWLQHQQSATGSPLHKLKAVAVTYMCCIHSVMYAAAPSLTAAATARWCPTSSLAMLTSCPSSSGRR